MVSFLKIKSLAAQSHENISRRLKKAFKEAAETGVLAGYPVTDLKVTLIDGSYHEVDSSEMAFKMAAIFAFKEGMQKGAPVLLEPIMKVEVVVPEEYLGDVLGRSTPGGRNPGHGNAPGKCPSCARHGSPG